MNKEVKTIAVWGSNGSGKTVTSIKLAEQLSKAKKNVLIVFCDDVTPTLPTIHGDMKKFKSCSLGNVLTEIKLTQDLILENCVQSKNGYIAYLGFNIAENSFSYAEYEKDRVLDFFVSSSRLVDYVIFDCSSSLHTNLLSAVALEKSDVVLRLGNCSLKSVSYLFSTLPMLNNRFKPDRHIKILSNARRNADLKVYENAMGGVDYMLQNVEEIEEQTNSNKLLNGLSGEDGKKYYEILNKVIKGGIL